MVDALDFGPKKTPVEDFPFPVDSTVRGTLGSLYQVVNREGYAFLTCCALHEKEGNDSGWYPATNDGVLLAHLVAEGSGPLADCGRRPGTAPVELDG
jgi:hypothetical protein